MYIDAYRVVIDRFTGQVLEKEVIGKKKFDVLEYAKMIMELMEVEVNEKNSSMVENSEKTKGDKAVLYTQILTTNKSIFQKNKR